MNESRFKMKKNTFYFILKDLFVFKIFKCLDFFGHVEKRVDKKAKVNFKIYNVTN